MFISSRQCKHSCKHCDGPIIDSIIQISNMHFTQTMSGFTSDAREPLPWRLDLTSCCLVLTNSAGIRTFYTRWLTADDIRFATYSWTHVHIELLLHHHTCESTICHDMQMPSKKELEQEMYCRPLTNQTSVVRKTGLPLQT